MFGKGWLTQSLLSLQTQKSEPEILVFPWNIPVGDRSEQQT